MEINDILCRILQIEHGFQHIKVFTLENKEMKSLLGYQQFITFVARYEKRNIHDLSNNKYKGAYIRQIGLKDSIESTREQ